MRGAPADVRCEPDDAATGQVDGVGRAEPVGHGDPVEPRRAAIGVEAGTAQQALDAAVHVVQVATALAEVGVLDRGEPARVLECDLLERPAGGDPTDVDAMHDLGLETRGRRGSAPARRGSRRSARRALPPRGCAASRVRPAPRPRARRNRTISASMRSGGTDSGDDRAVAPRGAEDYADRDARGDAESVEPLLQLLVLAEPLADQARQLLEQGLGLVAFGGEPQARAARGGERQQSEDRLAVDRANPRGDRDRGLEPRSRRCTKRAAARAWRPRRLTICTSISFTPRALVRVAGPVEELRSDLDRVPPLRSRCGARPRAGPGRRAGWRT